MRYSLDRYSFELPDKWKGLAGVRKRGKRADIILLTEEDPACSGLLVTLKCVKRKAAKTDEYTELLGRLSDKNGENRFLYAVYGKEGSVSEENEDLYWRLRDRLWQVFESICPLEGYCWNAV